MDCNRHVCLKDLNNYLKKSDYLNGYTPIEQEQIRKNIGAVGKNDLFNYIQSGKYIELTYEELHNLIENNQLVTGSVYVITDFQSIYSSNVQLSIGIYQTWGDKINPSKVFKISAIALSTNSLDRRVLIYSEDYSSSNQWIAEYDYTQETLSDGEKTKGKITYLKDTNNNIAHYDFKNIKSRRTKNQLKELGIDIDSDYIDLYTFNTQDFNESSESYNIHDNQFEDNVKDNVFIGNECYHNVFKSGFKNNTFISSCYNNTFLFNTHDNNSNQSISYLIGNFNNINFINNEYIQLNSTKYINKINDGFTISYIDPVTLTLQTYRL